jgi:hypothetical protein
MAYITDENGNYKRTVRCGHCYEKEHNKSACPKRKQDLKNNVERYTKELAENKFTQDYQRSNTERYLQNSKDQLHKMATRGQNRKCGFCSETGHNRSTCPVRKTQVADKTELTIALRKGAAERMINDGFGPGSLVSVADPRRNNVDVLAIVTTVDFVNIAPSHKPSKEEYFNGHRGVYYQYVVPMDDRWGGKHTTGTCYIPLKYMNIDDIPEEQWYRRPGNPTAEMLSGVEMSEDQLLSAGSIEEKQVSKWVTNYVVDPR